METIDIILAIIFTIFAILGTICAELQRRGIMKPFLTNTSDSFHIVTTDGITLLAILMGARMIAYSSITFAILYVVILAGLFLFIRFRKR
ncbi:MAG: hypothetical protein LUF92_16160 [Clostridiales bacterium]|nr:hypothetical protein [Clostridiales bacterium]